MKIPALLALMTVSACATQPESRRSPIREANGESIDFGCTSAREYVTTYNYLKENEKLKIGKTEARNLAYEVSQGCRGAAQRFITVTNLLLAVRLDGKNAVKIALEAAASGYDEGEAFVTVFRYSYLKKHLDMSLVAATETARMFSVEFAGDARIAESDFKKLTEYCMDPKRLNLVRPTCVRTAVDITKLVAVFNTSVAEPFIKGVDFLLDAEKGPGFNKQEAVKVASQLVKVSPYAVKNYIDTYRFAQAKSGHALTKKDAHQLATKIAGFTQYRYAKADE